MTLFKTRSGSWIVFGLACALISVLRLHSFDEPLEADETIMAVIAHDWSGGGKPYVTTWENKPIGSYVVYRAGLSAFGNSENGVRTLALAATLLSTLFVFLILRRHHGPSTAYFMLVAWGLLTVWVPAHANGANSEVFALPFLLAALLIIDIGVGGGAPWALPASILVLLLSLFIKQVTVPFLFVPPLLLEKRWKRQAAWITLTLVAGIALYFLVYGLFGYDARFVARQMWGNIFHASNGHRRSWLSVANQSALFLVQPSIRWLSPFFITGAACAAFSATALRCKTARLTLGFFVAAVIAVVLPGWNRPHYFILLLPFVPLLLAFAAEAVPNKLAWRGLFAALFLLLFLRVDMTYLALDPREISKAKYDDLTPNWFLRDRFIGLEALRKGYTGRRVYVSNNHPGIIFYSHNAPATRYFVRWMNSLPGNPPFTATEADLRANPPDLIFLPNMTEFSQPFGEWVNRAYVEKDNIDGCPVFKFKRAEATNTSHS